MNYSDVDWKSVKSGPLKVTVSDSYERDLPTETGKSIICNKPYFITTINIVRDNSLLCNKVIYEFCDSKYEVTYDKNNKFETIEIEI